MVETSAPAHIADLPPPPTNPLTMRQLEPTLALATIIRRTEIRSLSNDFPVAFPFTLVAAEPILAQVNART